MDESKTQRRIDRRGVLVGAAAIGLAGCAAQSIGSPAPASSLNRFVTREGTGFRRNGQPFRYTGTNAWYLAWLGSAARYGDRARLARELDRLKAIGVTNIRLMAGAEESPVRNSIKPGFEQEDGTRNRHLFEGLDLALAEMGKRGMTAVVVFTNNWEWSGGMMSRLLWATGQYKNMNDPAEPWPAFPDYGSRFYANAKAVGRFRTYVRDLVMRDNTVTGRPYREDPTIMAWQLANEPRPGVSPAVVEAILPAYYRWIDDTAALIRSLDPNHLVSLGQEGTMGAGGDMAIVRRAHENIDYVTAHVWPLNWEWVNGKDLAGTWEAGKAKVEAYLDAHIEAAQDIGKPLVIEEFGFPRDGELYDPAVTTSFRQRFYRLIYDRTTNSLATGGPIAGTNFWAWNGEARAQHPDHRFVDGDTQYMGDPPHEPQGWYGVFDSDQDMIAIIRQNAEAFATSTA